jgi:pimeloyl-ACP methyl ester carboxylesterase
LRDLGTDPAFTAARQSASVRAWSSEDQREAAPDSVAFLTSIEPRRLPPDWRVKLAYVEAQYHSAGDPSPLYSLRPTRYNVDADGSSLSHAWVLPDTAVRRLNAAPRVELKLRYHLTLLQPHHVRLPADGRSHAVSGLGYCSAQLDAGGSHIDVECFTGLEKPAQISVELEDIPASRVYGPPDLAPRWIRWPFGSRLELSLGSPRLAKHDYITVTTWSLAGYLDPSLVLPGILGNDAQTCPLPSPESPHFQQALWRDTAAHEATSISVDEGVQLEVLDFGGHGSTILLLPGLGATAHSYDELAPLLAQQHRVLAITRRGTGYSSKPDFGFDTPRLAQDVLRVMDTLDIGKALLVGHSIAGDELTWLGGHHPERFSGLVYLDAAYDRSGKSSQGSRLRELNSRLPPEPPVPPQALRNYQAMSRLLAERGHVGLPEGELIAIRNFDKPFLAGTPAIDARTQQAIAAGIGPPDYAAVKIPALAIYAFRDPNEPPPPWYDTHDAELQATLAEIARIADDTKRKNIELFQRGVEKGQVLELQNATHYLIQSNRQQVAEAIEKFSHTVESR